MIIEVIKFVVPWLLSLLRDRTPGGVQAAIDLIAPILEEMLESGSTTLSVAFRAPYELRMIRVLDAAGLLEEA